LPAPPTRDAGAQLLDGLVKSYFSAVKGALTLQSEVLNIAQEMMANPSGPLNDLMAIMPELATPAERLPFNIVCQGPQKFGWTEVPMAEIQSIRQHCGGTVNDVILTVMTATIRRYAQLRGVRVKGRSARIMIPVNVRGNGSAHELGNRISFLPVTIPLDIRDPLKLFAFVRERMEMLKRSRAAELVGFAGGLFSTIPSAICAAIGPVASQLPLSLCNIIVTNIPGPQVPLYLVGHKMLSWYPYVPIGGEMGVNCAILSYNGVAYFGFTCDVNAVPDPENLEKFLTTSCTELYKASQRVKVEAVQKNSRPTTGAEEKRPKRKPANGKLPVAGESNRVRPNGKIPLTTKRGRKATAVKIKAVAPEPAPTREEKVLAVGA
jgi:diacylglycerol O-acyltransferase